MMMCVCVCVEDRLYRHRLELNSLVCFISYDIVLQTIITSSDLNLFSLSLFAHRYYIDLQLKKYQMPTTKYL